MKLNLTKLAFWRKPSQSDLPSEYPQGDSFDEQKTLSPEGAERGGPQVGAAVADEVPAAFSGGDTSRYNVPDLAEVVDSSAVAPEQDMASGTPLVTGEKESRFGRLMGKLKSPPTQPKEGVSLDVTESGPSLELEDTQVSPWSKLKRVFSGGESSTAVPIRILIGYLPEVTERDALEYAAGMAEKYFDQIGLAFIDAFKYSEGYVYEIHEGGAGKAYTPSVLEYFDAQGEFSTGEFVAVVLKTATRKVEVKRLRSGLVSVLLPESSTTPISEFILAKVSMNPAFPKRTGFLVAGAALFVISFMAMLVSALIARYQPYIPASAATVELISASNLPSGQWNKVVAASQSAQVKALRFKNNKWDIEVDKGAQTPAVTPPESAASLPPATVPASEVQ